MCLTSRPLKNSTRHAYFFVLLVLAVSACSRWGAPLTLADQIDRAEQNWRARNLTAYRIRVTHVRSIWHAQIHEITVENGVVVAQSASCIPAPMEFGKCKVEPFNAEDYTVPGLFVLAREKAQTVNKEWLEFAFDPTYGYPTRISITPDAYDADSAWIVESFEVLK